MPDQLGAKNGAVERDLTCSYPELFDGFVRDRGLNDDPTTWSEGVIAEWRVLYARWASGTGLH